MKKADWPKETMIEAAGKKCYLLAGIFAVLKMNEVIFLL